MSGEGISIQKIIFHIQSFYYYIFLTTILVLSTELSKFELVSLQGLIKDTKVLTRF